jgi:hypothetical protein
MDAKKKKRDILSEMLTAASPETLRNLLRQLAASQIEVRQECLEYLKRHVPLSSERKKMSDGEAVLLLWSELALDLEELNEYGGGDYGLVNHVADLRNMHGGKCRSKTAALIKSQLQGQSCHIQRVGFSYLLFLLSQQGRVLVDMTDLAEHF